MKKKIGLRRAFIVVLSVIVVVFIAAGVAIAGNTYRFRHTTVVIPVEDGHLEAVLSVPSDGAARGLAVMVHGDGPVESTQDGLYSPWIEGAASAGYATLSWSKPGIAGSTGNWLDQSMEDRAAEVSAAIDWALSEPQVPSSRIVLWGASQAGWVVPKVVGARDDIDAVVAVGTAVNWLSQGRFNLLAELEGVTAEERRQAIAESDTVRSLLENGATYAEYLAATADEAPMTSDRWSFVARNFEADAVEDLRGVAARGIPVLLMAGEHDKNVDMAESASVYREILGDQVTIQSFDSVHSMARPIVEHNGLVGLIVGIFWPRALLADGVVDAYAAFLRGVDERAE